MASDNTPIPQDMLDAIIKTFMVAHVDDSDEHLAQALVFNAGRLAWRMRESGLTTETKTSVSDVVTAADRAAEKFIADVLRAFRPEDGLLGEEGTQQESQSGRTWVIDPVDGTYNFTIGSDYWCSALALIEGAPDNPDRVIFGAVHRPAMGQTWFGGPDIPTTLDSKPVTASSAAAAETCLSGYLHPTDFGDKDLASAWQGVVREFATVRMFGSASVDLGYVAAGQLGCWMQHSVKSWDWLPGRALVEGAGGKAVQIEAQGTTWSIAGSPAAVDVASKKILNP